MGDRRWQRSGYEHVRGDDSPADAPVPGRRTGVEGLRSPGDPVGTLRGRIATARGDLGALEAAIAAADFGVALTRAQYLRDALETARELLGRVAPQPRDELAGALAALETAARQVLARAPEPDPGPLAERRWLARTRPELGAALRGGLGYPLPDAAAWSRRVGGDVSGVRIATGGEADQATGALGARALTVGQTILFGSGAYEPETAEGQHLLAHELAHTLQQSGSPDLAGLGTTQPGDAREEEAHRVADAVVAREAAPSVTSGAPVVAGDWFPFRRGPGGVWVGPGGPVTPPDNRPRPKLSATEYLKKYGARHAKELPELLAGVTFALPSPYATWVHGDSKLFGRSVGEALMRRVTSGAPPEQLFASTIAPTNMWAVVDKARDADNPDHPEQADEYHETVGQALANAYRDRIDESLARVLPRVLNEWNRRTLEQRDEMSKRNGGAKIDEHPETARPGVAIRQSHPIDYDVVAELTGRINALIKPDFAAYRRAFPSEAKVTARGGPKPVKAFVWQHDKGASNWIKVTDPLGATVEDVATELYGADTMAYKITAAPPLFGLEPMGLKPQYYKELNSRGTGTSPELRPSGGPQTLPQQVLSGPLADEAALDQARGFKKDKLPPGGLLQQYDQILTHFDHLIRLAKQSDGAERLPPAKQRVEARRTRVVTDATGQADLWGVQAREQLDVLVKCYEGVEKIDRAHASTKKQSLGKFEGQLLHDRIVRTYVMAAGISDMVVTARGMLHDADHRVKAYVVDWLDEVFRWLRGALINSRTNKRTGQAQDPKLAVPDLDKREAEIQRDLHKLRDTLLNKPESVEAELNAAYQKLSDLSVEVSLIRDIDACDAAWNQLKNGKSTMGWIRGLVPGDHGNELLANLQAEADGFDQTWNQILADWRAGKRDDAIKAIESEHNKKSWQTFFDRVAKEIRDQAELDKLMTFVAMIGIAVLSGGVGELVGAAVGGGFLGFTIGLATEVTVFTALSYAVVEKEHSLGGFWKEWKKNLGVFLLLKSVSAGWKLAGGEKGLGEILLQYGTINGLALYEANQAKVKQGRGALSIGEVLEISLDNLMFLVGVSIGGALVQPWVSKLALRGEIGAKIREADSLYTEVKQLGERVHGSKGKDRAAGNKLVAKQHDLIERQTRIVEELNRYAEQPGAAKDAGVTDAQLAKIQQARGQLASTKQQLAMVRLFGQLEPVSSGSYLIAKDGSIEGARQVFEHQKDLGAGDAKDGESVGVAKVGAVTGDPKSTRSFTVELRDGTVIKISERAGGEHAVPEGSKPDLGPAGEVGSVGGTMGRNVYRVPYQEAVKKGRGGGVDPRRVQGVVQSMVGMTFDHAATLKKVGGRQDQVKLEVPTAANPAVKVDVTVNIRVGDIKDAEFTANNPNAPHGVDSGPAHMRLGRDAGGKPEAEVLINSGLVSDDVVVVMQHELNEIADIVSRNPSATEADIAREQRAGVFQRGTPEKIATAHERAAASELRALHEDLVREKAKHKVDADIVADKQARIDRQLEAMGLDGGKLTPEQEATLEAQHVPEGAILDISSGGLAKRRRGNVDRNLSDWRDAQPSMGTQGPTKAGHARSKHSAARTVVLEILNNPQRIFTGVNDSGRAVDIYWRENSVVITEVGQKDVVITAFGPKIEGSSPVDPLQWATDPRYREVIR